MTPQTGKKIRSKVGRQYNPYLDPDVYDKIKRAQDSSGLRPKDFMRALIEFYLGERPELARIRYPHTQD